VYGLGAVVLRDADGLRAAPRRQGTDRTGPAISDLPTRVGPLSRVDFAGAPAPTDHRRIAGMDADLARILDRCLETDPARRPRDAVALLALLRRREHRRRQRPMLWVGLCASILALCITVAFGLRSKNVAIDAYQRELTEQQLDGDLTSASIVAQGVQAQLLARIGCVEAAATKEMYRATRNRDRGELERFLHHMMSSDGGPSERFAEATVTNGNGELIALVRLQGGSPAALQRIDPRTIRMRYPHFSWRDWFKRPGRPLRGGRPLPSAHPRDTHFRPVRVVDAAGRPVHQHLNTHPRSQRSGCQAVGVLEAAVRLDEMSRWLRQARIGRQGFTVLLDPPRLLRAAREPRPPAALRPAAPSGFLSTQEEKTLLAENRGTIAAYRDPLMNRDFMGGLREDERSRASAGWSWSSTTARRCWHPSRSCARGSTGSACSRS